MCLDEGLTIKTVINQMEFDTKPSGARGKAIRDPIISFLYPTAAAQTIAMKEAQVDGIANTKEAKVYNDAILASN